MELRRRGVPIYPGFEMSEESNEQVRALRDALSVSPENVPLRKHLASTLAAFGRHEEASRELAEVVRREPGDVAAKRSLGEAYLACGKASHAVVVLEEIARGSDEPELLVLFARALVASGEDDRARHAYRTALDLDKSLEDEELTEKLGVSAPRSGWTPSSDDDERERLVNESELMGGGTGGGGAPEMEKPKVGFESVGGLEDVKEEIRMKIIHPLKHPEVYKAYGKTIGGGILMYGPPGCGKTHLARATAGEVEARFLAIGISDVLNMYIGQSEANLRAIFDQARQNPPTVVFVDEADALGASRADMRQSAGRNLINQFLSELDGVDRKNDGVLVLAATNAPWHIDPAFRRPGRFDRVIFVPPPDLAARAAIVEILLKGKPTAGVDAHSIAKKTDGFSGADLKAVVDRAVEDKLREAMKKGMPVPLTTKDLLKSAKSVRPSVKEWFATARNHALYANEGGLYDEVLEYLKK